MLAVKANVDSGVKYVLKDGDALVAVRNTRDKIRAAKVVLKPHMPNVKAFKVQFLKEVR